MGAPTSAFLQSRSVKLESKVGRSFDSSVVRAHRPRYAIIFSSARTVPTSLANFLPRPKGVLTKSALADSEAKQIAHVVSYISRHLPGLNRKVDTAVEVYKSPRSIFTLQPRLDCPDPARAGRTVAARCSRDLHVQGVIPYHGSTRVLPALNPKAQFSFRHPFTSFIFVIHQLSIAQRLLARAADSLDTLISEYLDFTSDCLRSLDRTDSPEYLPDHSRLEDRINYHPLRRAE